MLSALEFFIREDMSKEMLLAYVKTFRKELQEREQKNQ